MLFVPSVLLIIGITLLTRMVINKPRYKKSKGVCTGRGADIYEEYNYEYNGHSYTEYGWRPGLYQSKGKEYPIWVNKKNPRKIMTRADWCFSWIMTLQIPVDIWLLVEYL